MSLIKKPHFADDRQEGHSSLLTVSSSPEAYKRYFLVNLMFTQLCCQIITGSRGNSGVSLLNIVQLRSLQSKQAHKIVVLMWVGYLVNASFVAVQHHVSQLMSLYRHASGKWGYDRPPSKRLQRRFQISVRSFRLEPYLSPYRASF